MKTVVIILLCIVSLAAWADALDITGYSWHEVDHGGDATHSLNETNFGLGWEHPISEHNTFAVGFYDNSFYHHTNYFADIYQPFVWDTGIGKFKYGVMAGLVSGYAGTDYIPLVLPMLTYEHKDNWGINVITLIPPLIERPIFAFQFKLNL